MRVGKNGLRQQKFVERKTKKDQLITHQKSKIYQKNRKKEKAAEENKSYKKIEEQTEIRKEENT